MPISINQMKADCRAKSDRIFFWSLQPFPYPRVGVQGEDVDCTQAQWDTDLPRVKYNCRLCERVDKEIEACKFKAETLTQINRHLNEKRGAVRDLLAKGTQPGNPFGKSPIEIAVRRLARLHLRLYGHRPWETWLAVRDGTVNLSAVSDTDHDTARADQDAANREHERQAITKETERIDAMERYGIQPEGGETYAELRAAVKARQRKLGE